LDQDYRELTGQYDRLVSVEMIEAVGHQYLPEYFSRLGSLLKPDGRMVLQAITVPEQRYRFALKNVDFIKRYIFPGGFLPSVEVMLGQLSRQTRLVVQDIEDIGHDYALTLRAWRERFLGASDAVASQGFDGRFRRTWDYYLAYCEGAFLERAISTVQLVAAGPAWRP
ncbi:MAG: class I SAM-dependent methyltransferase, partial [Alcanivoracaceae bacterium]